MNSAIPFSPQCWLCGAAATGTVGTLTAAAPGPGICPSCERRSQPYDAAWQQLSRHLRSQWRDIVARGSFDLSKAFPRDAPGGALDVHLAFVQRLAARLQREGIAVEPTTFAAALLERRAHPEVVLLIANAGAEGRLLLHDSEVSLLRSGEEVQSALWVHLEHPVAVKVCWLKAGAPVREPEGFPWHPTRQRKIVKLSPYKGDTQPLVARRDLRI